MILNLFISANINNINNCVRNYAMPQPLSSSLSMDISYVRLQALKRQIFLNRPELDLLLINNENKNIKIKKELIEEVLYTRPSDFIDEFGRILETDVSKVMETKLEACLPKHLQTSGLESFEKLKNYMKKRFPERLVQCQALASVSEKVHKAWRSKTRKREAEWGDPEDLGVISNDLRLMEFKSAPELPQMEIEAKFLLPRYFVPMPLAVGSKLYFSNRPIMVPTQIFSYFTANTAIWSSAERKTFIELYLQNPKNFGRIAAHLPYKSCEQCVEFYYRHKKEYRLKQMVASYRKAMVAQRKMILNTQIPLSSTNTNTSNNNNSLNMNILPMNSRINTNTLNNLNTVTLINTSINNVVVDDETTIDTTTTETTTTMETIAITTNFRKKTGRPVGRPKNKDRQ